MIRLRFWAITCALILLAVSTVSGQVAGRVNGAVLDPTGAGVPDASVTLQLAGTGTAAFMTKSTSSGDFTLIAVPANSYDLVIEAKGFLTKKIAAVKVDPGRSTDVPAIRLDIQGVTQTVEVSEVANTVQTSNSEVSTTIAKSQIVNLPVVDRSPLAFVTTQAGVNSGRGSTTVNGQRVSYTNVTLDGINIQDNFLRTNAVDFLPNLLLLDQVAEVTLSTSNASAANFGGSSQISFVTPSGGNEYHGNAYWSNRNNYFRANDFFDNQTGTPVPFMNLNQLGGSVGGYVIKNKLFFYTNYEAYRQRQQTSQNYTLLTKDARNGIFTYKDTAGNSHSVNILQAMGVTVDPTMAKYLAALPTGDKCNNNDLGDSTPTFSRNTCGYRMKRRDNRTRDNVTAKGDYYLSERNSFSVTYIWNRDLLDRPDADPTFSVVPYQSNSDATKLLSSAWRWNPRPTLTNEMRFGFNWAPAIFLDTQDIPSFFVIGTTTSPSTMPFSNPIGGVTRTQGRNTDTYNYSDNASWVHGVHTVQFGYQMQATRIERYDDAGITPTYTLGLGKNVNGLTGTQLPGVSATDLTAANNLLASLAGYYNTVSQTFNVSSRTSGFVGNYGNWRHLIQNNYALYAQDNWKLSRRVTLTAGVRWDYYPPTDERDALALLPTIENNNPIATVFDPNLSLDFAGNAVGRPWWQPSKRHFAPNLGIAWDPTGEGKWAVRAGYSIAYVNDNIVRAADNSITTNAGLSSTATLNGVDGQFNSNLVSIATPAFKVPRTLADNYAVSTQGALAFPDPGLATPYVQQWNIGVQRNLKSNLIDVRYVGNHATKSIRGFDYNQVLTNQLLPAFNIAANNGWLAQAATGSFNATYNSAIPGSQPTPFFNAMPNGGYLTNSSVRSYLQTGAVGDLANFYQINGINGPYNFYTNPNILGGNVLTNYSNATYNALQVDITRRMQHGFTFQANYSYSKVLSDAGGDQQTDFEPFLDINNTKIERRRVAGFDITHVIKGNFVYELPFGPGKRFTSSNRIMGKVIGGWQVAGIYTQQSGTPFSVLSSRGTLNRSARSSGANTVNTFLDKSQLDGLFQLYMTGNGPMFFPLADKNSADGRAVAPDGATPFNGQVFFQPAAGTLGTLQRNMFSGPWVWNLDAKISKLTHITERKTIELRMDAVNVFNHTTWYVGDQTVTSTQFGKITSQFYGNRELQFALYFRF